MSRMHQKQQKPEHQTHRHPKSHGKKRRINAAIFMAVIGGIFGLSFGWFTSERSIPWSLMATLLGAGLGYLFGHNIDRSAGGRA